MLPLIDLRRIDDDRGSLCVIENLPFDMRRLYYMFDLQPGSLRGGHAHRKLERWIIATSGGFTARLDEEESARLYRPDKALYIGPMRWLELYDFSPGAVCLVIASAPYDADDYIRSKEEWQRTRTR